MSTRISIKICCKFLCFFHVFVLSSIAYAKDQEVTGDCNIQIQGNDNKVDSINCTQDEPVDISGTWKQSIALSLSKNKLISARFPLDNFGAPPYTHELLGEYNLLYKDRQSIILAIKTKPLNYECHACAPYLSFFEFEKISKGWKLIGSDVAAIQTGSWGDISSDLTMRVIGTNQYGVFLEGGYTAQGHTNTSVDLYTRIGDRFRNILSVATSEDDLDEKKV
jgi:hypothetical protein